jgi:hypothetical protein
MTAPNHDEEWRKKITSTLRKGATVITIDNIEGRLEAASLASVLTAVRWGDRILGATAEIELPQRATWLATGNNIRLGGDLQRRCYRIGLDSKNAKPWLGRTFTHKNLPAWVVANRGELVAALLILSRAWFSAGCPSGEAPIIGSFEEWCRIVGGILSHSGVSGFLDNLDEMYEQGDDEAAEWEEFLHALSGRFPSCFTTSDISTDLRVNHSLVDALPERLGKEWADPVGHTSFGKKLGNALSSRVDRRYGTAQYRVESDGKVHGGKRWKIVKESMRLTS